MSPEEQREALIAELRRRAAVGSTEPVDASESAAAASVLYDLGDPENEESPL